MKKMLLITVFTMLSLLNAACLGDKPGEVYFYAYTKDGSGTYTIPALYKTTNYGQTATLVAENFNATIFKDKAPGVFYKIPLGSEALYISQDTCRTWQWQSVIVGVGESFRSGVFPGECSDGRRFSTDYGKTWITYPWSGVTGGIYSWCLGLEQGEVYTYPYNQKLYRSTDYGDNFTMINDTLNLGAGGLGCGWVAGELFFTIYNNWKKYRSIDYGNTFSYLCQVPEAVRAADPVDGHLPNEVIRVMVNRYSYPSYNNMVIKFYRTYDWYQTIDSVTTNYNVGIEDSREWRVENGGLANYPNPFNNTTVINYSLSVGNHINLAVYNAKGELVKNLYSGRQYNGLHQITFNADGLNSGVYYIKLNGKNISQTTKCLLVK